MFTKKSFILTHWPFLFFLSLDIRLSLFGFGLYWVTMSLHIMQLCRNQEQWAKRQIRGFMIIPIIVGVMMSIFGGLLYWPDRPNFFFNDGVAFRNENTIYADNFRAFSGAWRRMKQFSAAPEPNLIMFLQNERHQYMLTDNFRQRMVEEEGYYHDVFIPALSSVAEYPGLKNVHIYQVNFPYEGPIYLQAGDLKIELVIEFEDSEYTGIKNYFTRWKIDNIAPFEDIGVPEKTEVCYFGTICYLPSPASNY